MNTALPLPYLLGNGNYPPSPPYGNNADFNANFYANDYLGEGDYGSDPQGISQFAYPTPSAAIQNSSYNPSAFHSSQNPTPQPLPLHQSNQIHQSYLPNYLDLPGPSTYNTQLYNNSSPTGSGSRAGISADGSIKLEGTGQEVEDDVVEGEDAEGGEDGGEEVDNEEPLYVNAKQYHRILKRRAARQRLEELNRLARSRKPYLHESRHRHACSRPRGKGGRFLTAEEIEALKKEAMKGDVGGIQIEGAL